MKIKAILLAAGNSTRFKENKLFSEVNGQKMIIYPLEVLKDCGIESIIVSQYDGIARLADEYGFMFVFNDRPHRGISYSILLGLQQAKDADGVVFLVADQPFFKASSLRRMIEKVDEKHILRCVSKTRKGNPVYFPKCYFNELMNLKGDVGGKQVIAHHFESVEEIMCDEKELIDIDTFDDKTKLF